MKRFRPPLSLCLLAMTLPWANGSTAVNAEAEQLFVAQIQPLLKTKCLACHGDDEEKIKGGLDLRMRETMIEGGTSVLPAVVEGKPEESPMYLAVMREHEDWEAMPPKDNDRLSTAQIDYLKQWITGGAPWPDESRIAEIAKGPKKWAEEDGVIVKTSGGLDPDWTDRRYKPENLWAYQPLRKPAVPGSQSAKGGKPDGQTANTGSANPIDAFINATLAESKLTPAPPADRRTLIRRATYDLTGLPPTPEEVAEFVADLDPDDRAFARVVDQLLASPHYGENMARHWLDIVRYADSSGLANDFARGNTWRYRDYVIRAFNDDRPYDHFVAEQLAGDEITERREQPDALLNAGTRAPDEELMVATGFLRMGPWELTAMEVPKVARQKFLDDVTDSVGQVFLAHPMQCARCHDHKFDPIPTRDYYSLQAVFATTQMAERAVDFLPVENTDGFEEKKYLLQRQEHYRAILKELDAKSIAAARAWYLENKVDPAAFEAALADNAKGGAGNRDVVFNTIRTALMKKGIPEDQIPPKAVGFEPVDYGIERIARKGVSRIRWELERYEPIAFSVYSGRTPELKSVTTPLRMPDARMTAGELERTHILTGGDPFADGQDVAPAVLSAATELGGVDRKLGEVPAEIVGRRLALARWIASPQNPLTARVMANRLWQWHFGQAIAGNPNNFGATGKKPTHPELLDWLAATFVEGSADGKSGPWSIKAMHRVIMNSEAYRRAARHPEPYLLAERDPDGASYAVFQPRRLTAEELRDTMLALSGELNRTVGGIPARPEINREAALQPRQVMGTFAEAWQPAPLPAQRHRRSIYVLKIRGLLDPFMEVFNAPSPDLSCEARDASTVTPQVFAMFNSEASLDRAVALAARVRQEAPARDAALTRAFQLAFGRTPDRDELAACLEHYDTMKARHRALEVPRPALPREVVRDAIEENTGERFTFTEPLETAVDFVPDLKLADVPLETRALAEVCLVLLNTNEFSYVY